MVATKKKGIVLIVLIGTLLFIKKSIPVFMGVGINNSSSADESKPAAIRERLKASRNAKHLKVLQLSDSMFNIKGINGGKSTLQWELRDMVKELQDLCNFFAGMNVGF